MTPILGITASSISAGLLAGSYESIETVSVTSATQASIEFTNIPGTYQHLQIRYLARSNRAGQASDGVNISVNSSAMTDGHYLFADGSSVSAGVQNSIAGQISASTATANVFGVAIVDILDYANTNKNKTVRTLSGFDNNGSGQIVVNSTFRNSTSAITSVKFEVLNGTGFVQNSSFALYGIK